jgi:hypothetical protein
MSPEILTIIRETKKKDPVTTLQIHVIKWRLYFRIPTNLPVELFYIKGLVTMKQTTEDADAAADDNNDDLLNRISE